MRRAKIVCTLGPATSGTDRVRRLVDSGMDVARMNFSHGSRDDHRRNYTDVREAADATGRSVAILQDLQGPKIRLGRFAGGPVELVAGARFVVTTEDVPGDATMASTSYAGLAGDVRPGDPLLVDDGRIRLRAVEVSGPRVVTEVEVPGVVSDNKGINLPGVAVSVPALTEKDAEDLRFGLRLGVDLVALSFVRNAVDVEEVRKIMAVERVQVPVLAKVEKPQAVENLREIIDAFDGIMVARGDLGVELPLQDVPIVQKRAVEICRRQAKPVIVATQMLESMISSPRPTRAEASDVANAVLDGADALMLSGETAVGRYPFETVETMARIIAATEEQALDRIPPLGTRPRTMGGAITRAAADVAELLGVRYLVCFTQSGDSARRMSRLRGRIPLLAFTPDPAVRSQLSLSWGIETFLVPTVTHTDDMVRQVDEALLEIERCRRGDLVVIVAGSPPGTPGSTNALRVHRIGDAVDALVPAYE
jgi:pyruvate kinase